MADRPDRHTPSDRPVAATAENGFVLLDGPQGAVASLTAEAAAATSENLRRAASQAERQRRAASDPGTPRPDDKPA